MNGSYMTTPIQNTEQREQLSFRFESIGVKRKLFRLNFIDESMKEWIGPTAPSPTTYDGNHS